MKKLKVQSTTLSMLFLLLTMLMTIFVVRVSFCLTAKVNEIDLRMNNISKESKEPIVVEVYVEKTEAYADVEVESSDDRIHIYEDETCESIKIMDVECDTVIFETVMELSAMYPTVDPKIIMGIMYAESRYKPDVTSNGDCVGLMQISQRWHGERARKLGYDDLYDIRANIHTGYEIMSELLEDYTLVQALHIYNQGWNGLNNKEPSAYALQVLTVIESI